MSPRARHIASGALLLLVVAHLLSPVGNVGDATYSIVVFFGAGLAWAGTARAPAGSRRVPALLAAGVTASAIADAIWIVFDRVGIEPDASIADIAYMAGYVFLGWALLIPLFDDRRRRRDIDALIDVLTVGVVTLMFFWTFTIDAIITDSSVDPFVRAVMVSYPVADAVLLALTARVLISARSRTTLGLTFAVGLVAWLISDTAYLTLDLDVAWMSGLVDLGWMLGAVLVGQAAWRHTAPPPPPPESVPDVDPRLILGRVAVAIGPLFVPPLFVVALRAADRLDETKAPYVAMVALLVLTFVRTARLLRSEATARAEVALSRRYFAKLADNSSDAIVLLGPDGSIRDHTAPAADLTRHDTGGARFDVSNWITLLAPDDAERMEALFAEIVATPGVVFTDEAKVIDADGKTVWLSSRIVNLVDDPDVGGIVISLSDVTARKQAELELAHARDAALEGSRAKSAFLATMSHEIRTPLNGVIGLTGLLLTTDLDERQQTYAHGVQTAGNALLGIINDILDFSKVEAGRLELEHIDFDLLNLVEETAQLLADPARAKSLELLAYCSPDLPLGLRGDPNRLRQVLLNLTSNAIKFTETGEVVLAAHLDDVTADGVVVRFEVSDTGIGIDPDQHDHLFEAFSQADSSTTRRYGGTGLGLAISRQLVTAMDGTIGADPRPTGGTTFWVRLPLPLAHHQPAPSTPADQLTDHRVLVVDDNQTNRLILTEQLTTWGMHVEAVADAAAALEQLTTAAERGHPYDLAVLDLCMPGTDGLELAARITGAPHLGQPGLVLLTSGPDVTTEQLTAAGIRRALAKPVPLQRLNQVLREVVPERRPAPRASTSDGARPGAAGAAPPAERGHVLVVEDSEINQLVAVGILEHLGYTADVAPHGQAALDALRSADGHPYDAVLMDCQMPVMDGYEATAHIRAQRLGGSHLPVIAMTASAVEGDRERCLTAGMDDYISKPVSPDDVHVALRRWIPGDRGPGERS